MKYYGIYTKNAGKAVKTGFSGRIMCQVRDGMIYLCTGFVLFSCTSEDYDAIFRSVLKCDPGNWAIDSTGKHDSTMDVVGLFEKFAQVDGLQQIRESPVHFQKQGKETVAFWSGSWATLFNPIFAGSFDSCTFWAAGPKSGAVVKFGDRPVGIVMPVNISEAETRAVRAFVGEEAATVAA